MQQNYSLSTQGINKFLKDVKDAGIISHLAEQYNIENYGKKQPFIRKVNTAQVPVLPGKRKSKELQNSCRWKRLHH